MGFLDGIADAVSGVWDHVVDVCASVVQTITGAVTAAVNTVVDAVSGVGANIAAAARSAVAVVGGRAFSLVSKGGGLFGANDAMMDLPVRAANAIGDLLKLSPGEMYSRTRILSGLKDLARGAYDSMIGAGLSWLRDVVSALSSQVEDLLLLPVRAISNSFKR